LSKKRFPAPSAEPFELELTGMAHGGSAVGRHDGRAIFVPYGLPGETITAQITEDKGRFAFAEQIAVLSESPARVTPRCPHFIARECGGCHWQHIDYPAQLEFKRGVVADQMRRLGGIPDAVVHPTIPSPDPWMYRSNVTFHVMDDGQLGFVSADEHTVVPIRECHIIRPELLEMFRAYQPDSTLGGESGEVRLRFQVGSDGAERLIAAGTSEEGVTQPITEREQVNYTVKGLTFQVSAGSFFQVNLPQAETLVNLVLDRLSLRGNERLLDLYSGVGLFTAFLAEKAAHVTAVESFSLAVEDAMTNLDDFSNVDLIETTVAKALSGIKGFFNAVVLDPPRAGMDAKALDALTKIAPPKIVYVSCDPATLARDAKGLVAAGYRLLDVQPVDMFPQTYHIESVATFSR
jgi:23S rRNA (uracil1939-C5)-methyltransferase